jgi:hypothetical protein
MFRSAGYVASLSSPRSLPILAIRAGGNWPIVLTPALFGKLSGTGSTCLSRSPASAGTLIGIAFTSIRPRITSFPVRGGVVLAYRPTGAGVKTARAAGGWCTGAIFALFPGASLTVTDPKL